MSQETQTEVRQIQQQSTKKKDKPLKSVEDNTDLALTEKIQNINDKNDIKKAPQKLLLVQLQNQRRELVQKNRKQNPQKKQDPQKKYNMSEFEMFYKERKYFYIKFRPYLSDPEVTNLLAKQFKVLQQKKLDKSI